VPGGGAIDAGAEGGGLPVGKGGGFGKPLNSGGGGGGGPGMIAFCTLGPPAAGAPGVALAGA